MTLFDSKIEEVRALLRASKWGLETSRAAAPFLPSSGGFVAMFSGPLVHWNMTPQRRSQPQKIFDSVSLIKYWKQDLCFRALSTKDTNESDCMSVPGADPDPGAEWSHCRWPTGFSLWAKNRHLTPSPEGLKSVVCVCLDLSTSEDLDIFSTVRVWLQEQHKLWL